MSYKPTVEDLAWAKSMINLTADGGFFVLPNAFLVYRLDKENKRLTRSHVMGLEGDEEMHGRTVATFNLLGWTVTDPEQN